MDEMMVPPAPAEGEAKAEESAVEVVALEGDAEAQAALALVALIDALPGCSSVAIDGLDGEDAIVLLCRDAEGKESRVSVSADAIQMAIDEGVEPEADEEIEA